jgi:hypothetical protein
MAAVAPAAPDGLKFMEPTPEMEAAMKRMNYGLVKVQRHHARSRRGTHDDPA